MNEQSAILINQIKNFVYSTRFRHIFSWRNMVYFSIIWAPRKQFIQKVNKRGFKIAFDIDLLGMRLRVFCNWARLSDFLRRKGF